MKTIPTSNGNDIIVDDEDYELISSFKWNLDRWGYARRSKGKMIEGKRHFTTILAHRVINKTPYGIITDHINGNTLDNRKKNLRSVTCSQNSRNRKYGSNNTSGLIGVVWSRKSKKWQAQIGVDGSQYYLGVYEDPLEAALVRDMGAAFFHREFACLNGTQ